MGYKFEIFKDKRDEYRFRFVAPNGEAMLQSEGYTQKHSAKATIDSLKKHVADADVLDESN